MDGVITSSNSAPVSTSVALATTADAMLRMTATSLTVVMNAMASIVARCVSHSLSLPLSISLSQLASFTSVTRGSVEFG